MGTVPEIERVPHAGQPDDLVPSWVSAAFARSGELQRNRVALGRSPSGDDAAMEGASTLSPRPDGHPWGCEVARYGWTAEISLNGRMDGIRLGDIERAWSQAVAVHPTKIMVVDMTAVSFIDASVARWLVESHNRAQAAAMQFLVLAPRGEPRELLRSLDVGRAVTLIDAPC
jgi:anti-anti-sigma regulatory factor